MKTPMISIMSLSVLLLATTAKADNNPALQLHESYLLTIPEVDFLGIGGYYQNAVLKHDMASGNWQLLRVKSSVPVGLLGTLSTVEKITTDDHPVQAFLKVSWMDSPCAEVGHTGITLEKAELNFEVWIYYTEAYAYPKDPMPCTADVIERHEVVALPVYGLEAGTYTYTVGGQISGSFNLPVDNIIE